jgi:predicted signal transduction protein with EAL and GGDEF domain
MGIAMFPVHGRNYNTLVMRAEQAMYAAKNSGKNMCLVYEPDPLWDSKE